jgi:hypothetical protein
MPKLYDIEPGYKIRLSLRKGKKYDILKNDKYLLSFGASDYEQYKDSTPLKAFSRKDHNDEKRKKLYYKRHGKTSDKSRALYWSNKYLW